MSAAVFCLWVQYAAKKYLPSRQFIYLCDLLLAGSWMLLALWFGSPEARFVVGASFLAGIVGLSEKFWPQRPVCWGYFFIALACAFFGPSIRYIYIRFLSGEYLYLSGFTSALATFLWFLIFPAILRQLDTVSGLVGHMLVVTFSLMLISTVLSMPGMQDAFFMPFAGLVLLGAFGKRFCDFYRQAGSAMSAMWGTLVAGTAILGVNKTIVFSSTFYLSLGLFAIPLLEASLNLVNLCFSETPHGAERLYRRMLRQGLDHPGAVRLLSGLCAFLGIVAALSQQSLQHDSPYYAVWIWRGVIGVVFFFVVVPPILRWNGSKSPLSHSKPYLWGVHIDNMSANYALTRARGLILSAGAVEEKEGKTAGAQLISTVNALAMDEAVRNADYHRILRRSAMVLSDGTGLLWGLRFLGMPIQERVTGIDFAEQLCRMAAAEGWPVYFLGAQGNTAVVCAGVLKARYPDLTVAGARDGYFDVNDPTVAQSVARAGTKILFVAMGIPRQEKWVARHAESLSGILAVGVGGAFDVLSGHLKRAPRLMQKLGLEWFFRLCQEPFRWKKDLYLFTFVIRILATRLGIYTWQEKR